MKKYLIPILIPILLLSCSDKKQKKTVAEITKIETPLYFGFI